MYKRRHAAQATRVSRPEQRSPRAGGVLRRGVRDGCDGVLMIRRALAVSLCAVAVLGGFAAPGLASQGSQPPSGFAALPAPSANSVWIQTVNSSTQPLDPSSSALVSTLVGMVNSEIASGSGPWINTTSYSVPVYTVPAGQPLVPVILNRTQPFAATLKASFAAGVPIPPGAQPAAGTDEHMVVYQPSSDTMWEFWKMSDATGTWTCQWGGTMHNVSTNPGYFTSPNSGWGATATSLPLVDGLITPSELQAGAIDHALAIALPSTRAKQWAFPAQRTDGTNTSANSIPEGARFRLDPTLNLASLNLPPATLALAEAAQQYGIIVRDTAGVVTFYAQDPTPTGSNPYPQLFGNVTPRQVLTSFPWSHLQLLQMTLVAPGTSPPSDGSPPVISGTATQGQSLSVSPGTSSGSPAPSFSYQWQDCDTSGQNCTTIPGATASTYTLGPGDVGSTIDVVVTATNRGGTATGVSAPTAVVTSTGSAPGNISPPVISGKAAQGQSLSVSPGTWSGSPAPSFSYQWQDCDGSGQNCTTIPGATVSTYTLGPGDVGSTIDVVVTATNSAGATTVVSAPTAVVASTGSAPADISPPTIAGTPSQGQTLTASSGAWNGVPAPAFSYQWSDCDQSGQNCAAISGATGTTYALGRTDVGSTLEVTVTATNSGGASQANSAPTATVTGSPTNTAPPTITGTASQGQGLTVSPGTWSGTPAPSFSSSGRIAMAAVRTAPRFPARPCRPTRWGRVTSARRSTWS